MENFMSYNFNITKIVLACFVPKYKGETVHRNRPSHGLAFHMSGVRRYDFDNGKHLWVHPNDIIYLPKFSNYDVSNQVAGECFAINFDITEDVCFEPFVIKLKNSVAVSGRFKKANTTWQKKLAGYEMKCKAELYNILYAMQQDYYSAYIQNSKLEIIKPAVDYIHNNYTNELLNISKLAGMCNITPEYFRSIFKNFYGVSPIIYINDLKINRAEELLKTGMYSVTEAALMSGYLDMSYFSRTFKKVAGVSPSEYKKRIGV